jgi:hypothetical protein
MDSRSKVLLLDDGDLFRIERMLKDFEVELEHLRGDVIREDLEGSPDVVIATVKRILALEGSVELTELPGKPVWIAVHSQDFLPLRVRLRKLGVHFLVQSSVGSEALRLLLAHAVYRGSERRDQLRLPVGSPVKYRDAADNTFAAELLDLARDGCRLISEHAPEPGSALSLRLPSKLAGGEELPLPGRIVRSQPHAGSAKNMVTVAFDEIPEEAVEPLNAILEGKVIGTVVTRLGENLSEETARTTIPGRQESEPPRERAPDSVPVTAVDLGPATVPETAVDLGPDPAPESEERPDHPPHERQNRRVVYTRNVTALLDGGEHTILGRDLSIQGMRSEPLPELPVGTELELAIYGPAGAEPVLVQAVVSRDDGDLGTVFRFKSMPRGDYPRLEAIIARKPEIRWLGDGEDGEEYERVVVSRTRIRPKQS